MAKDDPTATCCPTCGQPAMGAVSYGGLTVIPEIRVLLWNGKLAPSTSAIRARGLAKIIQDGSATSAGLATLGISRKSVPRYINFFNDWFDQHDIAMRIVNVGTTGRARYKLLTPEDVATRAAKRSTLARQIEALEQELAAV